MFVCFDDFFMDEKKMHSVDDSKTTFGSDIASFVSEIFHECCPFRNTPLPLIKSVLLVDYSALLNLTLMPLLVRKAAEEGSLLHTC